MYDTGEVGTLERLISDYGGTQINNVLNFGEVMEKVEKGTRYDSFKYDNKVPILRDDSFLIGLREMFEVNSAITPGGALLNAKNLRSMRDTTCNFISNGNSYNNGGNLERDFTYSIFEVLDTSSHIVLFRIHTGLDIRSGYTSAFAMIFDDKQAMEEFLFSRLLVAEGVITTKDDTLDFEVSAEAMSNFIELYIKGLNEFYDEVYIDLYDEEELINGLKDFLENEGIEFTDITVEKV